MTTIFGKIIRGELPSDIIYEDDKVIAIKDINPQAPVHLLIMPKKEYASLQAVPEAELSIISHIVSVAKKLAAENGVAEGYRLLTNNGESAGQTVFHLHFHLLGGRNLGVLG